MYWLLGGMAYVTVVTMMVRFFQFVSDADRAIEQFWIADRSMMKNRKTSRNNGASRRDGRKIRQTLLPQISGGMEPHLETTI